MSFSFTSSAIEKILMLLIRAKNENEVEVMILKQAIALGWDCPRAQILVLFRDWKSITFSIQTVGRIMRMPEIKKGHYKNIFMKYCSNNTYE